MRHLTKLALSSLLILSATGIAAQSPQADTANGRVEGTELSGINLFAGIPFAAPPVGDLRWRSPQPVGDWSGIRETKRFAARCMQLPVFGDMNFRASGMSEDCLYLNVWTPANAGPRGLPVLVYFYGGGFVAGDGSEPRYDGESMARRGIVTVTVNYRLGVFGFLAHPELSAESAHGGSGNYGLLDQVAALRWVRDNIAAFGGDPARITIAGESAGSASVSGLMLSPLSRNLIAGAIGESGSFLGTLRAQELGQAEVLGLEFAAHVDARSLADLRSRPGQQLLESTSRSGLDNIDFRQLFSFPPSIDGYYLPDSPDALYAQGEVADVPLLLGWNSEEMTYLALTGGQPVTPDSLQAILQQQFGDRAGDAAAFYGGDSPETLARAATDLAGDLFIAFATWKWGEAHGRVSGQPVYRYYYARPRPAMRPEFVNAVAGLAGGIIAGDGESSDQPPAAEPLFEGAVHSAEIEYAMGNLPSNRVYDWQPEDYRVSTVMQGYFENFIKTGNPNGLGLPPWPAMNRAEGHPTMTIDVSSRAEPAPWRDRYLFLESWASNPEVPD